MGRTQHTLTTTAKAVNKMGPMKAAAADVDSFAASSKKAEDQTSKTSSRLEGMRKATGELPGGFGKAAAGLSLMSGALGATGSATADAAAKLTDLVAMAATVAISLQQPRMYQADTSIVPPIDSLSQGGGLARKLGGIG